jgi:hypothetical protein
MAITRPTYIKPLEETLHIPQALVWLLLFWVFIEAAVGILYW